MQTEHTYTRISLEPCRLIDRTISRVVITRWSCLFECLLHDILVFLTLSRFLNSLWFLNDLNFNISVLLYKSSILIFYFLLNHLIDYYIQILNTYYSNVLSLVKIKVKSKSPPLHLTKLTALIVRLRNLNILITTAKFQAINTGFAFWAAKTCEMENEDIYRA